MSTLSFGNVGQSMLDNESKYSTLYYAGNSTMKLHTSDGYEIIYGGSFSYNMTSGTASGSVNSYSVYFPDGSLKASFSGINSTLSEFSSYGARADIVGLEKVLFAGNDTFNGGNGNDVFFVTSGTDIIKGNGGIDYVYTDKNSGALTTYRSGNDIVIENGAVSSTSLQNIERVVYQDKSTAYDLDGNAGITAKAIGAFLGKSGLNNKDIVKLVLDTVDNGKTYGDLMTWALSAVGITTPRQEVDWFWSRFMGSAPTDDQAQPFVDMISSGMSMSEFCIFVSELDINTQDINLVGLQSSGLDYA